MQISSGQAAALPYRPYRKHSLTRARPLNLADWQARGGVMATLENPAVSFQPGDYLCIGVAGEQWPTSRAIFEATKRLVSQPDAEGFCLYETTSAVQAVSIATSFQVQLERGDWLSGQPGDYLVRDGSQLWIVARAIFEQSYREVLSGE